MSAAKKIPPKNSSRVGTSIDVEFLIPFIDATINAMRVQASLDIKSQPPVLKTDFSQTVDIIGVVSLVSRVYEGSISLCFPKETFIAICNKLFGESHTEISSEIEDAAGELLNMVFGAAKAHLNAKYNYQIPRALPAIISGQRLKLTQTFGPTIVLPFTSELGSFHLEIEVISKK
jgi:chemotaxis protein CheX